MLKRFIVIFFALLPICVSAQWDKKGGLSNVADTTGGAKVSGDLIVTDALEVRGPTTLQDSLTLNAEVSQNLTVTKATADSFKVFGNSRALSIENNNVETYYVQENGTFASVDASTGERLLIGAENFGGTSTQAAISYNPANNVLKISAAFLSSVAEINLGNRDLYPALNDEMDLGIAIPWRNFGFSGDFTSGHANDSTDTFTFTHEAGLQDIGFKIAPSSGLGGAFQVFTQDITGSADFEIQDDGGVFAANLLQQSAGGLVVEYDTGTGELYAETSTRRMKENITDVDLPSDLFSVETKKWRDKESGKEEFGLIAEEVAEVMPELVVFDEEGKPLGIKQTRLIYVLFAEIKRLRNEISRLSN